MRTRGSAIKIEKQFKRGQLQQRDYVFDKQSKSHRLTVALLGAPPSRRRVDGERLRLETRQRDVGRRAALTR
jgi:hypothetical protein